MPILLIAVMTVLIFGGAKVAKAEENGGGGSILPSDDTTKYDAWFQQYSGGLNWLWLKAIALNESNLGRDSYYLSHNKLARDGLSLGLMQMELATAQDYEPGATEDDLRDDETSIRLAGLHLNRLYNKFGTTDSMVRAYNQGEGNEAKLLRARASGDNLGFVQAENYLSRFEKNLNMIA